MTEQHPPLAPETLARLYARRDLTDPLQGDHAMQLLIGEIETAAANGGAGYLRLRLHPVRGAQPGETPGARLACDPRDLLEQAICTCPPLNADAPTTLIARGPVHGHDSDGHLRLHGHQMTIWRLGGGRTAELDLNELLPRLLRSAVPDACYRMQPTSDPCLERCFSIQMRLQGDWHVIGRLGRLSHHRYGPVTTLLLELDELLALRKALPDAALLYQSATAVQGQMLDLAPWRAMEGISRAG